MSIPEQHLRDLREIFRTRMQERDFCIGEAEVEHLFRELLGEPEPVEEPSEPTERGVVTAEMLSTCYATVIKEAQASAEQWTGSAMLEYLDKRGETRRRGL